MVTLRKASERGRTRTDWLESWHSFAFGEFRDPRHRGFRSLRVLNEDRVAPESGFAPHPHRDMEIVTYVLSGALRHEDSLGHRSTIRHGTAQRMTAGSGIMHSEWNPSSTEWVHLLQIWILPEQKGLTPSYEERGFPSAEFEARLRLLASRDGRDGSLTIHQDSRLYGARLSVGDLVEHELAPGRAAWVQVAAGRVGISGLALEAGDGAAIEEEMRLRLEGLAPAELLLFDLG